MADTTTAPPGTAPPSAEGQSKAQEAASQAADKAQEVAGQAKDAAQQAAGQAKGRVRDQVDQRSTQAGEQVSTVASDVRSVGEQLREQGKEGPAKIAEQAADRAERVGSYLTGSDADRILSDVEDFARKQPWAVVAGGLALGFAASRFLKASSTQRYEQRRLSDAPTREYSTGNGVATGYGTPTGAGGLTAPQGVNTPHTPPPPIPPPAPTGTGTPHTSPAEGHPAGTGVRTDRDIGGPTAAPGGSGDATGGAPGTYPTPGLDPHR